MMQNYQSRELNVFTQDGLGHFRVSDITGQAPGFASTTKVFSMSFSGSNPDGGAIYIPMVYTQVNGGPYHVGSTISFLLAGKDAIEAALATETSARSSADTATNSALAAEAATRANADAYHAQGLSAETFGRQSADQALDTKIMQESGARVADVATITQAIGSTNQSLVIEAQRAKSAEEAIVAVELVEKNARIAADVSQVAALNAETESRLQADQKQAGDLVVETARSLAAEEKLGSRIDFIVSNANPTALDSLTEIVNSFNLSGAGYGQRLTDIEGILAVLLAR